MGLSESTETTLSLTGGSFSNCTGTINASILPGTPAGGAYRIRVVSNIPPVTGSANLYAIGIEHSPCGGSLGIEVGKQTETFYNDNDIKIYPNPAKESITVKLPANSDLSAIKIFDMNSRILKTAEIQEADEINIDVTDIQSGIYIVIVSSGIQSIHKKIVIAK